MSSSSPKTHNFRMTWRGAERRVRLREAATLMFLERGYEGASIDDIIKTVGGSKTNLYNYFGGKEGLFNAVVEFFCESLLTPLRDARISGCNIRDDLGLLGRQLLQLVLDDRHVAFQRLVIAESARFPAMAKIWFESGPMASREILAQCIRLHQDKGGLRPGDPLRLATFFHDMIVTNLLYLALIGTKAAPEEMDRVVEQAIEILLNGSEGRQG